MLTNVRGDPPSVSDGLKDFSDIMFVLSSPAAWLHLFTPSHADKLVTKPVHSISTFIYGWHPCHPLSGVG